VQRVTASADIAKGAVVTITPAAPSTAAACAEDGVGPFAVAIEAVANGKTGRVVTKGEVAVDCSGNCYTGAVVTGSGGKVKGMRHRPVRQLDQAARPDDRRRRKRHRSVVDVGGFLIWENTGNAR